jgi:AcrR family transcriptional regulator
MGRTRDAALHGAASAIAKYGVRKATMGDIAMLAGIAKATLYNHFRTRDDVYRALLGAQIDEIAARASSRLPDGLALVLESAAEGIAENPVVQRMARDEPAALARLAVITSDGPWATARGHVSAALAAAGGADTADPAAVDLVVRYLASQLLAPAAPGERSASCALLAAAISRAGSEGTTS